MIDGRSHCLVSLIAVLALALLASMISCAGTQAPPPPRNTNVELQPPDNARTLREIPEEEGAKALLAAAVSNSKRKAEVSRSEVKSFRISLDVSQDEFETVFNANEVRKGIVDTKRDLLEPMTSEALLGMRAYVNVFYPSPDSLVTFTKPAYTFPLVTKASAEKVWRLVDLFIEKIGTFATPAVRLAIDLKVVSAPSEARFDILSFDRKATVRSTTSDSQIQNLYRGYYQYKVTKAGFKTVLEKLNLVDSRGTSLDCKLYRDDEKDGPYPCPLK